MDDKIRNSFLKFFRENKRNRIENDGCAVWNEVLTDLPFFDGKQPRVSIAFSRYQGNNTNATVVSTILNTGLNAGQTQVMGYVLALPSYWLEVDEYLALNYVETFIDAFILDNYSGVDDGPSCGCPDNCPNNPPPCPPPPPPQYPPCPPPPCPVPSPFLQETPPENVPPVVSDELQEFNTTT